MLKTVFGGSRTAFLWTLNNAQLNGQSTVQCAEFQMEDAFYTLIHASEIVLPTN